VLFADDEHVEVEATWGIYQHMIAAYREPDRKRGRELMQQLIGSISHSVPTALRQAGSGPDYTLDHEEPAIAKEVPSRASTPLDDRCCLTLRRHRAPNTAPTPSAAKSSP
jgi:hypothetical protein